MRDNTQYKRVIIWSADVVWYMEVSNRKMSSSFWQSVYHVNYRHYAIRNKRMKAIFDISRLCYPARCFGYIRALELKGHSFPVFG